MLPAWLDRDAFPFTPKQALVGDRAFQPPVLQRFREARPHATATTFEDAGHWPHEEEPARCVEEIARLLALPRS